MNYARARYLDVVVEARFDRLHRYPSCLVLIAAFPSIDAMDFQGSILCAIANQVASTCPLKGTNFKNFAGTDLGNQLVSNIFRRVPEPSGCKNIVAFGHLQRFDLGLF